MTPPYMYTTTFLTRATEIADMGIHSTQQLWIRLHQLLACLMTSFTGI